MSKNIIVSAVTLSFVFISSSAFSDEPPCVPGEVIVQLAPKAGGEYPLAVDVDALVTSACKGTVKAISRFVAGSILVKIPDDLSVEDAVSQFKNTQGVLYAQPNYIYHAFSTFPNDPCGPVPNGGKQWGLHNTGQTGGTLDADIDAPEAWDIATDSNIIVAVIDSGVDYTHPDLAANMWHNPGEIPGNGIDDDNDGFIDDIYGYDFCNNDSNPMDDFYHGTHCAGIIGAVGNNALGITGVCWNVKIMALKFSDELGNGNTWNAKNSITYAVAMGAKVLSNSWGSYQYDGDLKSAIDAANAAGVLFIAAAGNDGYSYPGYPARFDCNNIISVMASDSNDVRAVWSSQSSSNWGPNSVDLAAPGSAILSCVPYGQYYYLNGTSMATPFVSGACALVWSMNPSLSHLQIKNIILNSVDKKPALNGLCVTGGRLNLFNALAIVNASGLFLSKVDDINDSNGVLPGGSIHYTISYHNPPVGDPNYIGDVNNAVITDFLPRDLAFVSASGPNSVYHPKTHTVTWNIGTLEPNESGSVTLTVKVNDCIAEYGTIANLCKISGGKWSRWARENTPVLCANGPTPTCGELSDFLCTGDPNLNLTWCPGRFAVDVNGHEVYFGTNFNDVYDANNSWPIGEVYKGTVTNLSYPISFSSLHVGTTYYWRIDEVNTANPDVRWRGSVWSFTTDCNIVDNFNSYGSSSSALRAVWRDGVNPGGNGTKSEVYIYPTDPSRGGPLSQSMHYVYKNQSSPFYSKAEATIGTGNGKLHIGSDWLDMGAEVLSLWFYGKAENDANQKMYITLTDGSSKSAKILYHGDMNDVRETEWHQWNIVLQDFVDINNVDLSNVSKIAIIFGNGIPAINTGEVIFEDIRLYLKKCFPGSYPVGDFEPDCDVDFYDFAIFAQAWLTSSGQPNYNPVCDISVPHNGIIDANDLARFCDYWLWQEVGREEWTSMNLGFGEDLYASPPPSGELAESTEQSQFESEPESQPEVLGTPNGEEPQPAPGIWLVYDGNTLPAPGDEITVYIHSDPLLLAMGAAIQIAGDANLTSAMSKDDCNSFGWDTDWNTDPYIDPDGWFIINGISWDCTVNGTVGYFKFRYNSGEVIVSFTEDTCAFDAYCQSVLFSSQPLIFGDPNQN